ncbi:uncharacterized protein MYCFIDRAFT_169955 [Pseudocercospora fijiensis CIRAD86]|uniref:Uncharacterized protein n=1 Tax=Pseudocercospora fijiensis (strain CIRAD86) TaxID=383855 RepID=N1Q962_PSEFD|nr:uncharacterized protein MYCFIDRAFT_169955 [Pseudocercospora fijiensis CIRAD86]EME88326.1 hypothetical protein MYCFIDRAFT_169955 [Pseudocercospora fijiensis CIRAD86]
MSQAEVNSAIQTEASSLSARHQRLLFLFLRNWLTRDIDSIADHFATCKIMAVFYRVNTLPIADSVFPLMGSVHSLISKGRGAGSGLIATIWSKLDTLVNCALFARQWFLEERAELNGMGACQEGGWTGRPSSVRNLCKSRRSIYSTDIAITPWLPKMLKHSHITVIAVTIIMIIESVISDYNQ